MNDPNLFQQFSVLVLPLLFAITIHEAAHGWVAFHLGDNTAYRAGRVTFNPIKHIDPFGTIILPLIMYFSSGMIFGWAKPVPIDSSKFRHQRRDMGLVALAGPLSNLSMAIFWALSIKLSLLIIDAPHPADHFFINMANFGISINLLLMILNLLPILPLDGGRILHSLLPTALAKNYARLEPFGLIIIIILLITNILGKILLPPFLFIYSQLLVLIGL